MQLKVFVCTVIYEFAKTQRYLVIAKDALAVMQLIKDVLDDEECIRIQEIDLSTPTILEI